MDDLDPFRRKDGIEGRTVLAIVVSNDMRECLLLRLQVPDELPGLLGHPGLRKMRCNNGNVCPTGSDFDEEHNIKGLKANGFDGEEIARQLSIVVVIEERSPNGQVEAQAGRLAARWVVVRLSSTDN